MLLNNNTTAQRATYLNQINLSTKLQQQVVMIPDGKTSSRGGRNSPRCYNSDQHALIEAQQRKNNFYTAIQGKGINVSGMYD